MPTASFRSVIKWPKSLNVTVEIDPELVQHGETVGMVGLRLARMGGKFLEWRPNLDRSPAVARFEFETPLERAQFVTEAAHIPGVSITAKAG